MGLGDILLKSAPEELRGSLGALEDLDARLENMCSEARGAWPDVELSDDALVAGLGERLPTDMPAEQALGKMRPSDLFLALACADRDARALSAFHRAYFTGIRLALGKAGPPNLVDEMAQKLMAKLFVGDRNKGPAITKYGGRGALASWVQVIAARDVRSHLRKGVVDELSDDFEKLVDNVIQVDDGELATLKQAYRDKFKLAFQHAFRELDARERNIMRLECIDGLNIDEIGAVFGVHRSTVARWRAAARTSLFKQTRWLFSQEFKVSSQEFDSVMRLIQSQVDVSLLRLLRDDAEHKLKDG